MSDLNYLIRTYQRENAKLTADLKATNEQLEALQKLLNPCSQPADGLIEDAQAAQAQAGDGSPYGYVSEHTNGMAYFHTNIVEIYRDTALSITPVYAAPPAAQVNQQLLEALKSCEQCLTFIHGGEPLRADIPLQLARAAIAAAQEVGDE